MKETSKKCSCGSNLCEYTEKPKQKKPKLDLMCWNCGLCYKANGTLVKINSDGVITKVGKHDKIIKK